MPSWRDTARAAHAPEACTRHGDSGGSARSRGAGTREGAYTRAEDEDKHTRSQEIDNTRHDATTIHETIHTRRDKACTRKHGRTQVQTHTISAERERDRIRMSAGEPLCSHFWNRYSGGGWVGAQIRVWHFLHRAENQHSLQTTVTGRQNTPATVNNYTSSHVDTIRYRHERDPARVRADYTCTGYSESAPPLSYSLLFV